MMKRKVWKVFELLSASVFGSLLSIYVLQFLPGAAAQNEVLRVKELRILGENGKDQIVLRSDKINGSFLEITDKDGSRQVLLGISEENESKKNKSSGLYFRNLKSDQTQVSLMTLSDEESTLALSDSQGKTWVSASCYPERSGRRVDLILGQLTGGNVTAFAGEAQAKLYANTLMKRLEVSNEQGSSPAISIRDNKHKVLSQAVFH